MTATIMDEFQVLQRYHVLVLDREAAVEAAGYRINGVLFDPVPIHSRKENDTMPKNFIAIRYRGCFKGENAEFISA